MATGLNPPQRAAVRTRSGPLLVLAGAGTGKTRVITYRIAELIKHGVKPDRILAVTFTNKAAREMRERATALLGRRRKGAKKPEISTFHSLCVRILRRHIEHLGYPRQFAIYDRGDQESVARAALRDIRVGHEKLRPGDLLYFIGNWKTHSVRPPEALEIADTDKAQLAALAYEKYQASLKASGAVDFDDLLLCTEDLFERFPEVRFAEATRFDHLLIDEYQDTNGLQYRIVRALAERHRNICVVGDDDQSIYGWRGAEVTHILGFAKDWPEAKVVKLEDNYRSCEPILQLANTLIRHNSTRHDKTLRAARGPGAMPRFLRFEDEAAEAQGVVRELRDRLQPDAGGPRVVASDFAILFRTNEQPRAFEMELRKAKIPYVLVGGMSFYDRKEIRDVLSYLRVLANPADEVSLLRIINTPARGIGTGTVETLLEEAVSQGVPLWNVLPGAIADGRVPHAVGQRVEHFRQMVDAFRARLGSEPLRDVVASLISTVDYKSELERAYKNPADVEARWASVEEMVNAVAQYESSGDQPSLVGFLEETALAGRDDTRDDKKDKRQEHSVTLMTLHSAKGLEFPHVYLVGMEEGLMPHQRSVADGGKNIAEERRLCYVGVTRAKDTLTLTLCKGRMKWGKLRAVDPEPLSHGDARRDGARPAPGGGLRGAVRRGRRGRRSARGQARARQEEAAHGCGAAQAEAGIAHDDRVGDGSEPRNWPLAVPGAFETRGRGGRVPQLFAGARRARRARGERRGRDGRRLRGGARRAPRGHEARSPDQQRRHPGARRSRAPGSRVGDAPAGGQRHRPAARGARAAPGPRPFRQGRDRQQPHGLDRRQWLGRHVRLSHEQGRGERCRRLARARSRAARRGRCGPAPRHGQDGDDPWPWQRGAGGRRQGADRAHRGDDAGQHRALRPRQRRSPAVVTAGAALRRVAVAAAWPLIYLALARYGVDLLPLSFAHLLDLETYLALVQIVTAALGIGLCFALCRDARDVLALRAPAPRHVLVVALLAPAVYVGASLVAIQIALPTLLDELQRGGTQLAQKSTGEFGRALVVAPAALVLLWGAVVSPIAEELMFRGAIWSAVQGLVDLSGRRGTVSAPPSLPPELISEGAAVRALGAVGRFIRDGGIATLVAAAIFAWMHADKPGGLGIVRVASAAGLGLACGLARQWGRSLAAPIALHMLFNLLSVATTRRWVVTASFPVKGGVPTLLEWVAAITLVIAVAAAFALRPRAARAGA